METQTKLSLLKENQEDFEWYPTTGEMIGAVFANCGDISSILDIGAGDGRVLDKMDKLCQNHYHSKIDKFAIENALTHIENMPDDISIVGTDFRRQTLIDKKVDLVFCNPPYSEYEDWTVQIIKEANAKQVFLIIPQRWTTSKTIEQAIKQRNARSKVVWSGDFLDGDRPARSKVDIVKIVITDAYADWEREKSDPFDVWFKEYFEGFERLNPVDDDEEAGPKTPEYKKIVEGQNLIERLEKCYLNELNILLSNYKTLSKLDAGLLKEIGVATDEIKKALKMKIEGLKNKYWQELFDNLDKITNRLTTKSRQSVIEKMNASCNIDFSADNAYAVVLWVIKNANKYIDEQLVEVFKELSEPECVKNYKSNLRTWEKDGWRYKKDFTHYTLEYRIISSHYSAIVHKGRYNSWDSSNGLHKDCHNFINDIFTIANNLGFANCASSLNRVWESNKEQTFRANGYELVKIRAFKNGNIHLKFHQDFIRTLNVEASRLLGWIKSPKEASDEMGISVNFVNKMYGSNLLFGLSEGQKLLSA